ncbi:MAG: 4Fe-4S dicluster domain-containing protein [Planctomycetes bacterium]|nr:4Fe-4S dicluster domain-containing protein [Planctomycetota bacterium]
MKIETLKRLAGKGVWDLTTLTRLRDGNDDCTRCGLCADICPSGIDLVRLWTTADVLMDRLGCPDNYTTAMDASFGQWTGRGGLRESGDKVQRLPGEVEIRGEEVQADDTLSGLIGQAEAFEHCVQCTLCTNACPVAAYDLNTNDFGPHQVMNLLRLGEQQMASGSKMVWHCLTCYTCQEVCPKSIRVADILLELRCRGHERAAELTMNQLKGDAS